MRNRNRNLTRVLQMLAEIPPPRRQMAKVSVWVIDGGVVMEVQSPDSPARYRFSPANARKVAERLVEHADLADRDE